MPSNSSAHGGEHCDAICRVNTILWSVLLPPLVAMGLIGNFLIVMVFSTSQKRRRRKPVLCITMITLACADALVFLFPITRHWLRQAKLYVEFDPQTIGTAVCKAHEFFVYFSLMFSTWMVVLVSGERFAIICFPLRRSRLLTPRRVVGIIAAMGAVSALNNAHFRWTREFVFNSKFNRMSCQNADKGLKKIIVNDVSPLVDMVFAVILPFILLFLFTAAIAHKLYRRSQQLKTLTSGVSNSSSTAGRHQRLLTPTTRMVLPVPLVFIPLALPVKVWLIVFGGGIPKHVTPNTPEYHHWRLRWSVLLFLQFCNFASNFFIYSLMSADFRSDLARMLCNQCWRRGWCRRRHSTAALPTAAGEVDASTTAINNRHVIVSNNFDDESSVNQMEMRPY